MRRAFFFFPVSATLLGVGAAVVLLAACSKKSAGFAESERGKRDTRIRAENCSKSGGFDTNRDGKKDLFETNAAGRLACRASDLDFDGMVDQTTFYDPSGVVRRREIDLDGNGVPNLVETYRDGKLTLREIDGTSLGKLDMWDSYEPSTGERTRRERDTNGDGKIDQYWTFAGPRITVRFDRNDDGLPDEEGALVWGEGFETAAAADAGAGLTDAGVALPTQGVADAGSEKPVAAPEGALTGAGARSAAKKDGGAQ